ncbi:MAG: glycine cleavage system aminomethyltransferase GcvT [Bacteroidales bacterium]|nr:glycine cleavage system aminomethyltransferase GcvT [Bacteroidales bacterium]MBN2818324.1 glycine cleavage system aminomethyltransferase GcvT [Bacteroidales bacterium]
MKNTSLVKQHLALKAKMVPFAGYNMPLEYSGVIKEHMAVRDSAGIFDVSHMGEFWVKGKNAIKLLQKITTNDVSKLSVGQAQYSILTNGKGGIVDDLIIYRYEDDKYMTVVNAANIEKDWEWFNSKNTYNAELENASDSMSLIALQGPKAKSILQQITDVDLDAIQSFHFTTNIVAGEKEVIISNTGYTGAGGYEIYCYNESAGKIWDALIKAGEPDGLLPTGLAARDTLRLEMGYSLYGNDIDDSTSPIEAGLGWVVKFVAGKDFIDRPLLEKQKKDGVLRKLVGFEMIGRGIPRHDYELVNKSDEIIGKVTSGTMSPILQKGIGMGYIKSEYAKVGEKIFVKIRNKAIEASVIKMPFI